MLLLPFTPAPLLPRSPAPLLDRMMALSVAWQEERPNVEAADMATPVVRRLLSSDGAGDSGVGDDCGEAGAG